MKDHKVYPGEQKREHNRDEGIEERKVDRNRDEGIEQRKVDQVAPASAAGNKTTAASASAGKEVMSIDVEDISSVMIESTAKASTVAGVSLQSPAAALNIVTAAQLFVATHNWDGLESYLAKFLTEVQGDEFHPHPGLFCSLYQAHISYLIRKNQFLEARAVFDGKVKPLLDQDNDMYKPLDLEARVELLQNCVNNCLPLPGDEVEDINVVLSDYLMLYFPTRLQMEVNTTNSISDFLTTFNDEKGKRFRCLACQWVMSDSRSIICHIKHLNQVYRCCRVTKWMLQYLSNVEGEQEIDIQDLAEASSLIQSRKRKAPLSPLPPDERSVVIPVGLALRIWNDISTSNMLALSALYGDKSHSAVKAKEILFRQEELIFDLKNLFLSSVRKHLALGSPVAFLKVKSLLNLSDDLFMYLKNLPDVSELLLRQDAKFAELRRCFMVAAAERLPPAAPADVNSSIGTITQGTAGYGTSSSGSSNSISSRLL